MDTLTIIIPHRGSGMGLWATIQTCEEDLRHSNLKYNYVIVSNGAENSADVTATLHYLEDGKKLCKHLHFDDPVTPPYARQRGSVHADGDILFFFDNHCLIGRDYFRRAMADFNAISDMAMLHSSTVYYSGQGVCYQYKLRLQYNFWADAALFPVVEHKPYKIAAGGHGGFAVRRDIWEQVGGYGPEGVLVGYAGEEMLFDLKMWRYGFCNYIDPKVWHYHYAGERGYGRHFNDDYYVNLMVSAYVIGGEKWLNTLFKSLCEKSHPRHNAKESMFDLMQKAIKRSEAYAAEVNSHSVKTLDELLEWFPTVPVAF